MPAISPRGQRLVEILADMVRCAVAWEETHGRPPSEVTSDTLDGLTSESREIHCLPYGGPPLKQITGRDIYDGDEPKEE